MQTQTNGLTEADLNKGLQIAARAAAAAIRRYRPTDEAEIESSANLGALEAFREYDPARGSAWTTYVTNRVNWRIKNGSRPSQEVSRARFDERFQQVRLQDQVEHAETGQVFTVEDIVADPATTVDASLRMQMLGLLDKLRHDEKAVISLRYYADLSLQQTARSLGDGWNIMRVFRTEKRALGSLRGLMDAV